MSEYRTEDGEDADLLSVPPDKLRRHPRLLYARRAGEVPAKALAYARGGGSQTYDDIAYRYDCACPAVPFPTIDTLAGRAVRERRRRRIGPPQDVARLVGQRDHLAHRHLVPPDGHNRIGFKNGLLYVMAEPRGEIVGRFPLAVPNRSLESLAEDEDVRLQPAEQVWRNLTDSCWLPLDELVDCARFPEMREAEPRLVRGVRLDCHYVFVSHRWLSTDQPDPEGTQARLVAWHLFASLCDAVRVAHRRGLHTPRRMARMLNAPIGTAGSDLVESLVVRVLRQALDEAALAAVARQVERVDADVVEDAAARAHDDTGLVRLRGLLDAMPRLRPLMERIRLWYDYSCVPQGRRTPEEERRFRRTLETLSLLQYAGRTLVLLDDVADYLGRAWCSLEAATALVTTAGGRPDVLSTGRRGGRRAAVPDTDSLSDLVHHRQAVIWRGLLDTELFRLQTREECLRRLGLSMAEPGDLDHIYDSMLSWAVPSGHRSRHALVTGVFPLPARDDGSILIPAPDYSSSKSPDGEPPDRMIGSLDCWDALKLRRLTEEEHAGEDATAVPPYWRLPAAGRADGTPRCHVAVVAECEGEALLLSSWVRRHYEQLEKLLRVRVVSGSWLAQDPAPVGHLPHGRLRVEAVEADVWVVMGKTGLAHNEVGQALSRVVFQAGVPVITVCPDRYAENVSQVVADVTPGAPHSLALDGWDQGHEHSAGLLYMHLYSHLLQWGAPIR